MLVPAGVEELDEGRKWNELAVKLVVKVSEFW